MTETLKIVNGDWVVSRSSGQLVTVTGRDKLRQDVHETLAIAVQDTGFGAGLDALLGRDVDPFVFQNEASRQIRRGMNTLQYLQGQFRAAQRTDAERLEGVTSLRVGPVNLGAGLEAAKTAYSFVLKLKPVGGETLTTAGTLAGGS